MDHSDQDWNASAKSLKVVPDDVLRQMLTLAPQGEVAMEQCQEFWKSAVSGLPSPSETAMRNSRAWREIFYAFTRAEAAKGGWEIR